MSGDTIFICEGDSRATVISSKGFVKRSPEPQTDIVTNGPRGALSNRWYTISPCCAAS